MRSLIVSVVSAIALAACSTNPPTAQRDACIDHASMECQVAMYARAGG